MGRLTTLQHTLIESYNDNDGLKGLCLALDVRFDDLNGETFTTKTLSLIRLMEKRGRLPELLAQAKRDFPDREWASPAPPQPGDPAEIDDEVGVTVRVGDTSGAVNIGDITHVDAKGNTGNVAVGSRNVIQIGTLNLPRNTVLAGLAAILAVGAVIIVLSAITAGGVIGLTKGTPTPKLGPMRMTGSFNVAITNFPERDLDGQQTATDDGFRISTAVFNSLSGELKSVANAQVWHDSMPLDIKGASIGIITGTTVEERQASAKALATRIGAHLVIYGDLNKNQSGAAFSPEFYIDTAAVSLNKTAEAEDVTGQHRLGTPVQVPLPFKAEAGLMLDDQLKTRAIFVRGLLYDLIGLHDKALADFRSCDLAWREESGQGREVLDFFLGREALFLWVDEPKAIAAFGSLTATLDYAEQSFSRPLATNPTYALSNWGLGTVYFRRAEPVINAAIDEIRDQAAFDAARADVVKAMDYYRVAMENTSAEVQPQLTSKMRVSLANAQRLDGVGKLVAGDVPGAKQRFEDSLETANRAFTLLDDSQARTRAIAYYVRGASYQGQAIVALLGSDPASTDLLNKAKTDYEACLNQYDDPQAKVVIDASLRTIRDKNCKPNLDSVVQVLSGG